MSLTSRELEEAHNMGQQDYAEFYKKHGRPLFGPAWFSLYMVNGIGRSAEEWEEFTGAYETGWNHAEEQFEENERNGVYDYYDEDDEDDDEEQITDDSESDYDSPSSDSSTIDFNSEGAFAFFFFLLPGILSLIVWDANQDTERRYEYGVQETVEAAVIAEAPPNTNASDATSHIEGQESLVIPQKTDEYKAPEDLDEPVPEDSQVQVGESAKDPSILTCRGLNTPLILLQPAGYGGDTVRVHTPQHLTPYEAAFKLYLSSQGPLTWSCTWDKICTITNQAPVPVILTCEFVP